MSSSPSSRSQLITAGFQPRRFSFAVKLIRSLIWPFIRPFHFFLLDKLTDLTQHMQGAEVTPDKINHLINELVFLRTEVTALKYKVISNSTSSHLFITATEYGLFIGKPQEKISDSVAKNGVWDAHIINFAKQTANTRRGVAIDVGAHFGSSMLALSSIFDHVHSFEPNDFNFRILSANAALNNLHNVNLYNHALYSRITRLSLGAPEKQEVAIIMNGNHFDGLRSDNLGAYLFTEHDSGIFNHLAKTLDSYEFNNIAFIKIDAQGADGEVLMGAIETIRRCRPVIIFEWEEKLSKNFTISLDTIKNRLTQLGYEISILKAHNKKQIDYVAQPLVTHREL